MGQHSLTASATRVLGFSVVVVVVFVGLVLEKKWWTERKKGAQSRLFLDCGSLSSPAASRKLVPGEEQRALSFRVASAWRAHEREQQGSARFAARLATFEYYSLNQHTQTNRQEDEEEEDENRDNILGGKKCSREKECKGQSWLVGWLCAARRPLVIIIVVVFCLLFGLTCAIKNLLLE